MVDGMFVPYEAEMIKKIPLSQVLSENVLYCHFLKMEGTIVSQVTGF